MGKFCNILKYDQFLFQLMHHNFNLLTKSLIITIMQGQQHIKIFKNMSLSFLIFTHDIWYRLISNLKTSSLAL